MHTDSSLGLSIGQLTIPNAVAAQGTNPATVNHAVRRAYRAVQVAALFALTVTQIIHALHRILVCVPLAGLDLTVI